MTTAPASARAARVLALAGGLLLGGCSTLLPSSRSGTVSEWQRYDDAVAALAARPPYTTTRQDVHAQGLGPARNAAVTTGWRVQALLVFVDDALVYRPVGGQPTLHERELRRNPLGPLQGWGDQSIPLIR